MQQEIINALHVKPIIDSGEEIRIRTNFLKNTLLQSGMKGYVLGISGGQDSTLAGRLAQLSVEELRKETGKDYKFIAVRLPYGIQRDEEDAQLSLDFIQPDETMTINIKKAVDASIAAFEEATGGTLSDFHKGNTKARERMKAQYDLGGHYQMLVIGTDHAAEAVTGFYTKHGDGACDLTPLSGLTKRQGKQILQFMQAPQALYLKVPTADLEDDKPLLPDETALGMSYEEIDDYLEGKDIPKEIQEKLEGIYRRTQHKRELPKTPFT